MTKLNKKEIQQALKAKMDKLMLSGNRVSSLIGISNANVSHILNGNAIETEKLISNAIWMKVNSWVYNAQSSTWKTAKTESYKKIQNICEHSQNDGLSRAICHRPGSGKTFSLKSYANNHPNTYYIEGEEYYTKSAFLKKLLNLMGLELRNQASLTEMVDAIVLHLNSIDKPLLIIDEADKLKDGVLNFFKTFYNKTNSGFVLCGAPYFKQRIDKGVRLQRQCYEEIFSRIGGCFLNLPSLRITDVRLICNNNGIYDEMQIIEAFNYCEGDLRRVKLSVDTYTKQNSKSKTKNHA